MVRSTKDRSHFVATRINNAGHATPRCQAFKKRTNDQCGQFALKGKSVCAVHGGRSTGSKTPEGREAQRESGKRLGSLPRKPKEDHASN